jgi:hypothetical protein
LSRALTDIQADLTALGRPRFPTSPTPIALADFRDRLQAWRLHSPDGDARYEALLAEWEAYEARQTQSREAGALASKYGVQLRLATAAAAPRDSGPMALAQEWWAGTKPWLVMLGATGVGKSVAAAWVLTRALEARQSALWVSAAELATRAGGFDGQTFATRLKGVELLVIDDIGTEHLTDFSRSVRDEVLMHRHEAMARTVLTSNLDGKAFGERLGVRMADRLRAACMSKAFAGPSLRGVA